MSAAYIAVNAVGVTSLSSRQQLSGCAKTAGMCLRSNKQESNDLVHYATHLPPGKLCLCLIFGALLRNIDACAILLSVGQFNVCLSEDAAQKPESDNNKGNAVAGAATQTGSQIER